MNVIAFTEKKYHLENNFWVRGFKSVCNTYDESMEYYNIQKLRDNPRYKEIIIELNCSFHGKHTMIPVEIIDNFNGFEQDDLPEGEGWYLGIVAASQFVVEERDGYRKFKGPNSEWYKNSMIWWNKNESHNSDFFSLCELYTKTSVSDKCQLLFYQIPTSVIHSLTFNWSFVRDIIKTNGVDYLINLIENTEPVSLFYLFYCTDIQSELSLVKKY